MARRLDKSRGSSAPPRFRRAREARPLARDPGRRVIVRGMTPPTSLQPVTLDGRRVRMEPLDLSKHWDGLRAIGLDPDLWRFTTAIIHDEAELKRYLDIALDERERGVSLPFATIDKPSGRVAGCTRYANIALEHRRLEIGWTWVGRPFRRTYVNTEAKYLMLSHAFETLRLARVELKTSHLNLPSQNAMKRLGCVQEGTLRKHTVRENGETRDTVYFSILDDEWPAVKARLEAMMAGAPA
jgi:RimJ/RimL family protein N-acetyltransferase